MKRYPHRISPLCALPTFTVAATVLASFSCHRWCCCLHRHNIFLAVFVLSTITIRSKSLPFFPSFFLPAIIFFYTFGLAFTLNGVLAVVNHVWLLVILKIVFWKYSMVPFSLEKSQSGS
jgi:hypothetical protein